MMNTRKFSARITQIDTKIIIPLPFNPNEVWGVKQRHHINGYINGYKVRGPLSVIDDRYFLPLGASWCRDTGLEIGMSVEVVLSPEGPQTEQLDPDLLSALDSEPQAKVFFESLATFYRKAYIKWIDGAKRRPDIYNARIQELISLLKAGKKRR